jgi:hypothetical protein
LNPGSSILKAEAMTTMPCRKGHNLKDCLGWGGNQESFDFVATKKIL